MLLKFLKRLNIKKTIRIKSAHKIKTLLVKTRYRINKIIKISKTFKNYDKLSNVTTLLGNELKYTPKHFRLYLEPYMFDIRELLHYNAFTKPNPYTMSKFNPFEIHIIKYMEKILRDKGACLELPYYKLKKKMLKKQHYSKISLQYYCDNFESNINNCGHIMPIHILKQFTHHQIYYYFCVLMTYDYNIKHISDVKFDKIHDTYYKIKHLDFDKLVGNDLTTNIRLRCLIMFVLSKISNIVENKHTRLLTCQLLIRKDIENIYYDGVDSIDLWSTSEDNADEIVDNSLPPISNNILNYQMSNQMSNETSVTQLSSILPNITNNDIRADGL